MFEYHDNIHTHAHNGQHDPQPLPTTPFCADINPMAPIFNTPKRPNDHTCLVSSERMVRQCLHTLWAASFVFRLSGYRRTRRGKPLRQVPRRSALRGDIGLRNGYEKMTARHWASCR